ncbi:outer membrane protein assembly factor BamB family protein [Streptomyces chiangmaiensis]|uniref:PQQ-binding-like beta-propeller repeat protein n=1 Tax=Streptomyces chiangmaiensis TaxID=766497 RepID=A0ABU7FHT1_9ACTN|nr:PQQ-binding-like beta-propeller repeat protein [Streptomyces chiangmaiensis]MED7823691.1 PQQ-binding-like beta-propeller repeat protein [Streptomyces chiangmaiensis]
MSQPPPPPNQPPPGGFGAPEDPPPGGFGAPQDPPPGGFGVPQPPQSPPPPAQGPGYGYPQPQNPPQQPYGYPQQPGYGHPNQQPGYGYAPTVPLGAQGSQGGGRKGRGAQVWIIVAAVVAIALIIGGGVWYANSQGGDKSGNSAAGTSGGKDGKGAGGGSGSGDAREKVPADTGAKVLFQLPMPVVKNDSSVQVAGSWVTDKAYVKSGVAEIDGYDPDKGTKLWTIKLPGPVCAVSRYTSEDDRTAILYQSGMPTKDKPSYGCTEVAAIDLSAGRKLWTESARAGDDKISFGNITQSGDTVALGSTSGGAAFDLATGRTLWSPKPGDTCYDAGYGGGPALVAVRKCGQYGARQLHIQSIDPKSGQVNSDYKMATGIEYASVVSASPLVVAADVGDSAAGSGISDLFSIDIKSGALRTKISLPAKTYAARCDGITQTEACTQIVVGNGRVYVPTKEHEGSAGGYGETNEIVAFDLGTGKLNGQRADAGDGYTLSPLRMDGGNIIAYKRPPYDKGGQIVSIDGASFKETKLLENPSAESVRNAERRFSLDYAEIRYQNGRLYMAQVFADKASGAGDGRYLAVAFGTS